ncbi:SPOR domain-containing protein [Sphingomonas xanthus]|uniref:SPOR domain-containing protein n=1 Tax=Sphingomonas xanthus TaxID=2594473 RepID=A0A516IQF9_9SPHN|nr:SPOR domain-containing protein [Sphingomonas xanthus]QDP19150.1 hypothetical protein FMM02_03735 [Sphingomonas xanthus]
MLKQGHKRARRWAVPLAVALSVAAAPPAIAAAPESPASALSRHIRVLATSPRDFNALVGAGRAALDLGDVQAAAGFYGRAEEVNPNAPAAKAGLGAAMAQMGDADGAIFYFNQATRLGAQPLTLALDRGLARDLNGDLGGAQSDYRLAINSLGSDEARRRLALSLAIARDRKGALDALQPLLNRRDPAAQRTRAFVLALLGDQAGAAQAIEAVMPGGSAQFAPFFRFLPALSIGEKAAAVHLGIFPENAAARVAANVTTPAAPAVGTARAASPPPAPVAAPVRVATREPVAASPSPSFSLPSSTSGASPSFSLPSANRAASTEPRLAQNDPPEPIVQTGEVTGESSNLVGIDKVLATIAEASPPPPPAPEPKVEAPPPPKPKVEKSKPDAAAVRAAKIAADKKAAEKKERDAKLAAEKKEREEAARLGVKGTYWVQLAGGSNQDRMSNEYRKLSAKAGSLLKSRSGYVTEGKEYFRLLVGPFDNKSDSQAFVNRLAKEGVDGFSWTRTPTQIKIEKLKS